MKLTSNEYLEYVFKEWLEDFCSSRWEGLSLDERDALLAHYWQEFREEYNKGCKQGDGIGDDIITITGARCLGCSYPLTEGETHCCPTTGLQVTVTRFRVKCAKCGKETENFVTAPYGSKWDGDPICAECIDR